MSSAIGCQWCGALFAASRSDARFCSTAHRVEASRARRSAAAALHAFDTARQIVRRTLTSYAQDAPSANARTPLVDVSALVDAALADVRRTLSDPAHGGSPVPTQRNEKIHDKQAHA